MKTFDKKTMIRWKVYIDRSKMYIGYVQFLLIIFVFIRSLGDNPVTHFVFNSPAVSVPIILVLFLAASLVLGYFDSKFGFREEEIRNHARSNPVLMEIQQSLHQLNKKIERMESAINKGTESQSSEVFDDMTTGVTGRENH